MLASIDDLMKAKEEFAEEVELARNLSHFYDEFLDNYPGDSHKRVPGIHASELPKCKRMAYYSLTGVNKQENVSAPMRKRFNVGHALHAMVQEDLKRMAIIKSRAMAQKMAEAQGWLMEFEPEVAIGDDQPMAKHYKIKSSCDGIFTFRKSQDSAPFLRVGLEIKTEAPDSYEKLREPREDHVAQTHIYMMCLDLPLMWFFYLNKGNQNNTPSSYPWLIIFDPHVWGKMEERAEAVLLAADAKQPPAKEEGHHCSWCPYAWECKPSNVRSNKFVAVRRP